MVNYRVFRRYYVLSHLTIILLKIFLFLLQILCFDTINSISLFQVQICQSFKVFLLWYSQIFSGKMVDSKVNIYLNGLKNYESNWIELKKDFSSKMMFNLFDDITQAPNPFKAFTKPAGIYMEFVNKFTETSGPIEFRKTKNEATERVTFYYKNVSEKSRKAL